MFCHNVIPNFDMMCVFSGNQIHGKPKHSKLTKKTETRLNRQKDCRYEVLSRRRFRESEEWGKEDNGYQSDGSEDSISSATSSVSSSESITQNDILIVILGFKPQNERILDQMIATVFGQMNAVQSDWNLFEQFIEPLMATLFDRRVLEKVVTFIGPKGIRLSLQIKVLTMYEELVDKWQLSDQSLQTLNNSSFIPTLIQLLSTAKTSLVSRSLELLLLFVERNDWSQLLFRILNCGLIDRIIERTDPLKWKVNRVTYSDLRTNRRQLISENSFSSAANGLFRQFARAIYRLLDINMDDSLRMDLFRKTEPLIAHFSECPDSTVISTSIDCLRVLAKNQMICLAIVQKFDFYLYKMSEKSNEYIVLSVVKVFNALSAFPAVFGQKNFGVNLIVCLDKVMAKNPNKQNLDKEVIEVIAKITQLAKDSTQVLNQLSHRLVEMSLIICYSSERSIRVIAIQIIQIILQNISFECLAKLFVVLDMNQFLKHLMTSDDKQQRIAIDIIAHILNILSDSSDVMPEEADKFKRLVFGKMSDVYYYMEKLSFKTYDDYLSNKANQLLKQLDGKLTNDEDLSLLPTVNQNGFVFGLNF